MVQKHDSRPICSLSVSDQRADRLGDDIPTKAEILEDISQGYRFVIAGGRGQPIDDAHRQIAEELTRV